VLTIQKDVEEERKALENNTPFDTLTKHRRELLELIRREGHNVIGIFEEVVSGEYLSERPKLRKCFAKVIKRSEVHQGFEKCVEKGKERSHAPVKDYSSFASPAVNQIPSSLDDFTV
jgi:hypothetical protein